MSGLIDTTTGLSLGTGLNWLEGGLGGDGFDNQPIPATAMLMENGTPMLTESGDFMLTE